MRSFVFWYADLTVLLFSINQLMNQCFYFKNKPITPAETKRQKTEEKKSPVSWSAPGPRRVIIRHCCCGGRTRRNSRNYSHCSSYSLRIGPLYCCQASHWYRSSAIYSYGDMGLFWHQQIRFKLLHLFSENYSLKLLRNRCSVDKFWFPSKFTE